MASADGFSARPFAFGGGRGARPSAFGDATVAIRLASSVPATQRVALEELLFFNRHQGRVRHQIVASIGDYGLPQIVDTDQGLRVGLAGRRDAQSLVATAGPEFERPVGAIIYVRDQPERLVVAHIAVDEEHASDGTRADRLVILRLLAAVRGVARVTAGVLYVDFYYADGRARTIRIRRATDAGR